MTEQLGLRRARPRRSAALGLAKLARLLGQAGEAAEEAVRRSPTLLGLPSGRAPCPARLDPPQKKGAGLRRALVAQLVGLACSPAGPRWP